MQVIFMARWQQRVRGMVRHRRCAGLEGALPESVDPDIIVPRYQALQSGRHYCWPAAIRSRLMKRVMCYCAGVFARHTNGLQLTAFDANGQVLLAKTYYSVGGGFVVDDDEPEIAADVVSAAVPFPFSSAAGIDVSVSSASVIDCRS